MQAALDSERVIAKQQVWTSIVVCFYRAWVQHFSSENYVHICKTQPGWRIFIWNPKKANHTSKVNIIGVSKVNFKSKGLNISQILWHNLYKARSVRRLHSLQQLSWPKVILWVFILCCLSSWYHVEGKRGQDDDKQIV